ncbi:MAG: PBP1A family penicillin-binding protein [Thermostichales cyanobacterium SZTDM-1c_bins_54]
MVKSLQRYSDRQTLPEDPAPLSLAPWRWLTQAILASLLLGTTATAAGLVGLAVSFRNLPDVHQLRYYAPVETTQILDQEGNLLASLHGEANRQVIPIAEVAPSLRLAVLAIEDSHFYSHRGINPVGLGRAFLGSLEGGLGSAGGGSTITMQLVKNLFLRPERTLSRKVAEAVLAVRLEQVFSKDEIFEMYLNQVYWGHNLYGIQTAAQSYFGKSASDLTLGESALLAGLLQAPEVLSPFRNLPAARERQKVVLNRMVELGWISAEEASAAYQQELRLGQITSFRSAGPAVTDAIVAELERRFGAKTLTEGGLRIQSTIDMDLQREAERIVNEGSRQLQAMGRRADQMALVAMDPRTGYIKALVGGVNQQRGNFNRVTQARRQSGSTFKTFVYYTALATGRYSPYSVLMDTPVTFPGGYTPKNYDGSFSGPISFRQALELSRNIPTVVLANNIGIRRVIATAQSIGIESEMYPNLSTALGSTSVSPLEMTRAYAAFANGGYAVEPTLLMQVVDRTGQVLKDGDPQLKPVLDPWSVAVINQILQGVVTSGTGRAARLDDGRPVAGKTGTTSDFRDAWFIGYTPQLVTAIWIGNDNNRPMAPGTAGGAFVAPVWKRFMTVAMRDQPRESFPVPESFPPPRSR